MKWFGIFSLLAIFLFPQIVKGEITTVRDWVGVFALGAGDGKSTAADWKYTSSCTQTAGTAPKSQDLVGCTFDLTSTPAGLYEYRLYANDGTDPDALLAKSKSFSKDFMFTPSCSISGSTLNVTLEWPTLVGNVNKITIVRSDGTSPKKYFPLSYSSSNFIFTDTITSPGASYTYYGIAYSGTLSAESVKEVKVTVSGSNCTTTSVPHNLTLPPPPLLPSYGNCKTQSTNTRVSNGLISTPDIIDSNNQFGNDSGICVVDSKAAFAPYRIRNYDDLKSLYFTQSKATKITTLTSISSSTDFGISNPPSDVLYSAGGDFPVSGSPSGNGTRVIFVGGNLSISNNFTYGDATSGLVFVVKGDVIIDKSVTRIDAVIISQGYIYTASTAGAVCIRNSVTTPSALTVNGSLVSLDSGKPIVFCRKLADNSSAAEIIKQEPKYLVILRNLLADTVQRWSEI